MPRFSGTPVDTDTEDDPAEPPRRAGAPARPRFTGRPAEDSSRAPTDAKPRFSGRPVNDNQAPATKPGAPLGGKPSVISSADTADTAEQQRQAATPSFGKIGAAVEGELRRPLATANIPGPLGVLARSFEAAGLKIPRAFIAGANEAAVQGLSAAGLLENSGEQERARREIGGIEDVAAAVAPEGAGAVRPRAPIDSDTERLAKSVTRTDKEMAPAASRAGAPASTPTEAPLSALRKGDLDTGAAAAPKNRNPPAAMRPPVKTESPRRPPGLTEFLARNGGLKDFHGELRSLDAHKQFVPGAGMLVRGRGVPLDRAREAAGEAGYPVGDDVPSFLDALREDLAGRRVFSAKDEPHVQAWREAEAAGRINPSAELRHRAEALGIRLPADASDEELLGEIAEREAIMAEGEGLHTHADTLQADINRAAARYSAEGSNAARAATDAGREAAAGPPPSRSIQVGGQRPEAAAGAAARSGEPGASAGGRGGNAGAGTPPTGGGPPRPPRGPDIDDIEEALPGPRRRGVGAIPDAIQKIFSPTTVSNTSRQTEAVIRENIGQAERSSQQARAQLEQFRSRVSVMKPEQQLDFLGYVEGRSKGAALSDPKSQEMADSLREVFEKRRAELERLPSAARAEFVDDYFPHAWQDPDAARQVLRRLNATGGWQGSGRNLKQRTIPTIADGIAAGLKPATTNPLDTTMGYVVNMDRYIATNRIFDTMHGNGTVKFFAPGEQPEGWTELRGRLAEKAAGDEAKGRAVILKAYAPSDAARVYNNFISRGWADIGETAGDVYQGAQHVMNGITMAELSLSAFHAATMAQEAIVSGVARAVGQIARGAPGAALKSIVKSPAEPILGYRAGRKFEQQYLGRRDFGPDFRRIVELGTNAGMRAVGRGREYYAGGGGSFVKHGAVKRYFDAWRRGELGLEAMARGADFRHGLSEARQEIAAQPIMGTIRTFARNMSRVLDTVAAPLFDDVIPRLKNGAFYDDMADWLKAHPGASNEHQVAAARQIWDSIDNRFGELVMDDVFWHRALKQSLQLLTRSVGWDLGTLREIAGGGADILRGRGFGKDMSPRAKYVIALPIVTGLANAVAQYLKTGEGPKSVADLYAYRTGGVNQPTSKYDHATPERAMLPGYMRDVLGYIHDPIGEVEGKASSGVHLLYDLLTNRDYRGLPIGDPNAGLLSPDARAKLPSFLLAYLSRIAQSYEPISFKTHPKVGTNISLPERVLAIRPAPYYIQKPEYLQDVQRYEGRQLMKRKAKSDQNTESQYGR